MSEKESPNPKDRKNWRYLLLLLVLAALAMLVSEFSRRSNNLKLLEVERDGVKLRLEQQEGTHTALETEMAYAQSTRGIEEAGRRTLGMIEPGDVAVVLIAPGDPSPTPTPRQLEPTPVKSNLERWWDLFFSPNRP